MHFIIEFSNGIVQHSSFLNNICAIKSMILLEMKSPLLVLSLLFFRKRLQLLYSLRNKSIKAVTGVLGTFSKGAQEQQGTHEQLSPHRKTVVDHPGSNTDY